MQKSPDDQRTAVRSLAERIGRPMFRFWVASLWAYACVVFPFGRIIPGLEGPGVALIFVAGLAAIIAGSRPGPAGRRISSPRMLDMGMIAMLLVLLLMAADLLLTMRDNWAAARAEGQIGSVARERDSNVWHGELFPRMFVPAGQNFRLFKPNARVTGDVFGERYASSMLSSPTLVKSVLERRRLSYFIGPEGLRELEPLSASRIFALGDSFVFGFATDEGLIWPDVLGAALGEPVYNLGMSATGPRQHVDLLKYMLSTHADSMHPRQVLWMLFEGNDLENSYAPLGSAESGTILETLLAGTAIEPLFTIPERVRSTSMVRRLLRGDLALSSSRPTYGRYEIEGVELPLPLFHSAKFGYRLFTPADLEAATKPGDYVTNHPNRPLLDQTFREMRDLGRQKGFSVTVVIAPSDARLYGRAFEGFPPLSDQPHFVNYLVTLSGEMGFPVVNLLPLLEPYAANEMLYYRDDHHWNVRGNEVVAELIRRVLHEP